MFPSPLPPPPSSRATNVSYFQRTITQIGRYKRRGEVKLRGRRWLERKREREKEVSLSGWGNRNNFSGIFLTNLPRISRKMFNTNVRISGTIFVKRFYGSRRVDRQTVKVYIYIYIWPILGPRKTRNGQLSLLPLARQGYFISCQMIPISGVRNLETVTESRPPPFPREEISSPVPSSLRRRRWDKPSHELFRSRGENSDRLENR